MGTEERNDNLENTYPNEWGKELQAIDAHLEHAAHTILENCEKLNFLPQEKIAQTAINKIIEQYNFHDMNGQRLRKIIGEINGIAKKNYALHSTRDFLLNGPQRSGRGLIQGDVECVLSS